MDGGGNIEITTVAERPELTGPLTAIDDDWPVFVVQDPVACALWDSVPVDFAAYCVVATEGTRVVARGFAVPFDGESAGRTPTPDGGWDTVLTWAHADRRAGRRTPTASALEVTVDRAHLGRGLSSRMVAALCEAARRQGHDALYAPVRPTTSICARGCRWTPMCASGVPTGCPSTPGCVCTSGRARRSRRWLPRR